MKQITILLLLCSYSFLPYLSQEDANEGEGSGNDLELTTESMNSSSGKSLTDDNEIPLFTKQIQLEGNNETIDKSILFSNNETLEEEDEINKLTPIFQEPVIIKADTTNQENNATSIFTNNIPIVAVLIAIIGSVVVISINKNRKVRDDKYDHKYHFE